MTSSLATRAKQINDLRLAFRTRINSVRRYLFESGLNASFYIYIYTCKDLMMSTRMINNSQNSSVQIQVVTQS
jgi:hypothetical protein